MQFGAHVSVSSGYESSLDYARSVGCECMQIFAKSPRQWRGHAIDSVAAEAFRQARDSRGFGPVFTHTAYLINLSTSNEGLYEKSIVALGDELARGGILGADGVVTHVGNVPDADLEQAVGRVGRGIVRAFDLAGAVGRKTRLLLENTAGAGTSFGSTFEQLGEAIDSAGLDTDRLGVCLDTCHAFAYGYSVDCSSGWSDLVTEISQSVGLDRLGLIHANDCKFERGARRDRHEWIGDGHIGMRGFEAMVCLPELREVPVVTEMPGEVPDKDSVNIGRLVSIREQCGASQ